MSPTRYVHRFQHRRQIPTEVIIGSDEPQDIVGIGLYLTSASGHFCNATTHHDYQYATWHRLKAQPELATLPGFSCAWRCRP